METIQVLSSINHTVWQKLLYQSIETLNVSLKKTEIVRVVPGSPGVIKKRLEENTCKIPGNINLHEVQNSTPLETVNNHVENTQSIK